MLSDAPPSRELLTTSCTCRLVVEVKTLTSSGISAPARVPQEMISDSFHHSPSGSAPITQYVVATVVTMLTIEVSQTSEVSGVSKFILSAVRVAGTHPQVVDQVGDHGRDEHHRADREDPDQQARLVRLAGRRRAG